MNDDCLDKWTDGLSKFPLFIFLAALLLLFPSCGKKGPPTLKSYEKPPAPRLLSAYHREGEMTISWAFPADKEDLTEDFVLLRASDDDFRRISFPKSNVRTYTDTDFDAGKHYRYKIVARNHRGMLSEDSNILEVTPLQPPPPPKYISVAMKGDSIVLFWKQEQDMRCNIYKSFTKGEFSPSPLNASPLSGTSFTDSFDITRRVYYSIRSVVQSDVTNEGPASAEVEFDPFSLVPPAPEGLRAFAAPDRVILFWDAAREQWVSGFRVYRRTGDSPYELIGHTQIPTFVDTVQPLTKRDYRVTAVGPGKEGPPSEANAVIYTPQE